MEKHLEQTIKTQKSKVGNAVKTIVPLVKVDEVNVTVVALLLENLEADFKQLEYAIDELFTLRARRKENSDDKLIRLRVELAKANEEDDKLAINQLEKEIKVTQKRIQERDRKRAKKAAEKAAEEAKTDEDASDEE